MTTIDGRVQTLNMRAPDEATAQRVMALIEEAIRTAMIAGEMPGRVVIIRQLDVGTIPLAASRASVALAVEAAVQRVAANAVSGDDPAAATAPMIYFKDDATVVLSLARRVAKDKPATEWFWPSVVKGWTPNTPTDRAIPLLIERAMATSAGVVTVAQVVETLASTGVLDKLLERLSESDGRALLKAVGWTEAMVNARGGDAGPLAPQMPAHSQSLVQRWVDRWGGDVRDPRALWLGAMLLVADLPARSTNAQLPDVVRIWLASVAEASQLVVKGWTLIERAMATSAGVVTAARVVETLASTGVLDKLLARLSEADGRALLKAIGWTEAMVNARGADAGPLAPQLPAHSQALVQRWVDRWGGDVRDPRALWLGAMLLIADLPARSTNAQLADVVRVWLASVVEQSQAKAHNDARTSAATQTMQRDDLIADARVWLQSHPRSPVDSLFGGGPPVPFAPRDPASGTNAVERRPHDDDPHGGELSPDEPPTWKTPRPTNHAGLLFLVPLLTRTGVTRIVADNPGLIERDWTAALLLRFARRLGVPLGDPAIAWITAYPVGISHADRSLTAEVMRATRIRLRMEASLTMRQLVNRSGAVVATHSDVDVLLQHANVDAGVRRAGLDVDPGWTPWLGRVVQFHYLDAVDVSA